MMQQLQRKDSIEKAESRGRFTSDVKFQLFKSDFFAPKLTNTTSSPKYWSTVKILQIPSKCIYDIVEIYFQSSQNVNICDFVSNAHLTSNSGYTMLQKAPIGLVSQRWSHFLQNFLLGLHVTDRTRYQISLNILSSSSHLWWDENKQNNAGNLRLTFSRGEKPALLSFTLLHHTAFRNHYI